MNRRVVLAAAALLSAAGVSQARAQAASSPRPTYGALAGVNFATLSGDDVEGASSRTGFIGGGFVTFHFHNGLGLEPELLYSQQGASSSDNGTALRMSFVQIPVLLRYDFRVRSGPRPFVLAGPSIGIKVSCSASGEGVSVDCDRADLQTTGFDLGGTLGGGVAFRAGKQSLSLGARYTIGTNDLFENNFHAKSRFWSILAGIAF